MSAGSQNPESEPTIIGAIQNRHLEYLDMLQPEEFSQVKLVLDQVRQEAEVLASYIDRDNESDAYRQAVNGFILIIIGAEVGQAQYEHKTITSTDNKDVHLEFRADY